MLSKLEHIGIAVRSLKESIPVFEKLLGTVPYKTEEVESEGVKIVFFKMGDTKIELLETTKENSSIAKFINKRGEGIHHLAFDTDDIQETLIDLKSYGFSPIKEKPFKGADHKLVTFLHPKETNGVLIEVCQSIVNSQ